MYLKCLRTIHSHVTGHIVQGIILNPKLKYLKLKR